MSSRPIGITIASILSFVATAQYTILFALVLINRPAVDAYLRALSPGGAGPEKIHSAMGPMQPLYHLAMALFTALIGWGLWRLWNWTGAS